MNMKRLGSTLKLDILIQWRSNFYQVSIGIALLCGLALRALVEPSALSSFLPVLLLLGVGGTSFIYIAGLIVFERDQHTLDAQFVSPLDLREYWLSKLISLTLLEIIEGVLMVVTAQGFTGVNWLWVLVGILSMSVLFALAGLALIVRFASITDFLIPSMLVMLPLQLPVIYFVGISTLWIWLVSPASAPLMLLTAGWRVLETWELVYGLGYSVIAIAICYSIAARAFRQHIVVGKGS